MKAQQGFILPMVLIMALFIGFWTMVLLEQNRNDMLMTTWQTLNDERFAKVRATLDKISTHAHDRQYPFLSQLADWLNANPPKDGQVLMVRTCDLTKINQASLRWQGDTKTLVAWCDHNNPIQFWLTILPSSRTQFAEQMTGYHLTIHAVSLPKLTQAQAINCLSLPMIDELALRCFIEQSVRYRAVASEFMLSGITSPSINPQDRTQLDEPNSTLIHHQNSQTAWRRLRIYDVNLVRE